MPIFLRKPFQECFINKIFALCIALSFLLLTGCEREIGDNKNENIDSGQLVYLFVDYADLRPESRVLVIEVPYRTGMTVLDAMNTAKSNDKLDFDYSGKGETAFIKSIGGVSNQGAAKNNWIFYVNQELAKRSSGAFELQPGDLIEWRLGGYPQQ